MEEAYAIQTKSPQLNRRDEHLGIGFLILHSLHTLLTTHHWRYTQLTTHSTDSTLLWQHTLPTKRSTDNTLSYWQHSLPNLPTASAPEPQFEISSLWCLHSYPRTTGFLSLYYTYYAPKPHPSSKSWPGIVTGPRSPHLSAYLHMLHSHVACKLRGCWSRVRVHACGVHGANRERCVASSLNV